MKEEEKILHIWNQAGTAGVITKWQRKEFETPAFVLQDAKHDKFEFTKYYDEFSFVYPKKKFLMKCFTMAKNFDILHLHDAWFMVIPLRVLYPKKKIVMHYHGTMIREKTKETRRKIWERHVDTIFVSTPNLLDFNYQKNVVWIPNPVDIELFHPREIPKNGKAITILKRGQSASELKKMLAERCHDIIDDLTILDKKDWVKYGDFPDLLAKYEYYVDVPVHDGKIVDVRTTVGLQAMSMGLKVIDGNFDVITTGLPPEHDPKTVVSLIDNFY